MDRRLGAPVRSTSSGWPPPPRRCRQDADGAFTKNERARNKAVRDFATKWFADRGMKPTDCQANFMFVNIGTPAKAFRDACRAKGVMVARDFPPFEKTHGAHHARHDGRDDRRPWWSSARCSAKKSTSAAA